MTSLEHASAVRPADANDVAPLTADQDAALDRACARIAPNWPLDRLIAVSPYWTQRGEDATTVSARLSALGNVQCLMPPSHYLDAWQRGEITSEHLEEAAERLDYQGGYRDLLDVVEELGRLPHWHNISDLIDARRDRQHKMAWRDEITQQISQFCAAYFQEDGPLNAERLQAPRGMRLYQHWREMTLKDRGIAILMGEPTLLRYFKTLPDTEDGLFQAAVAELEVDTERLESYAQALLLDINGWAAWVAYQDWQQALATPEEESERVGPASDMRSLLAMRLAWELALWRYIRAEYPDQGDHLTRQWHAELEEMPQRVERHRRAQRPLWVWQLAGELAYQQPLHRALGEAVRASASSPEEPRLQAVFCIDVRSEPLRRALESQSPSIQTLGFAGFFGLPLEHQQDGTALAQPHLPGLLAPRVTLRSGSCEGEARSAKQLNWKARLQEWSRTASASFTAVETGGLLYAGKLLRRSLEAKAKRAPLAMDELGWHWRDSGEALTLADKATLARTVLGAMGLAEHLAPRVLLVGHGSHSSNNPHAAGLECGACGGQSGEVSVRALARLLNDPALREALAESGLVIPETTRFVPALHHTITDRIELPEGETDAFALSEEERAWLERAGAQARRERAASLGLSADAPELEKTLDRRGADWSQTRPEWGLANNASFIAAPRRLIAPLDLDGRSFLHDYDWRSDTDSSRLELIMTAPMVVAHWINMQYNASVTDNSKFGSGNKVLHNVVGGHIGVFEGNGGDLRIGLPLQSVHDGERWRHEPLRLSVYLAAPTEAIEAIIARHESLQSLVGNGWLHLFALDDESGEILGYRQGEWRRP
ncbi:YbcC family protein [Halomonas sp. B23F22_10]|uniref:YbcC family protein n=1 Tax=Halomonas sp. B23F22_10 TaxID=3459515 RepID=UPI00373E849B